MPSALALVGDVDVDLRRAHVDVPGQRPNDFQRDTTFGDHGAKRVAQRVRGAAILANAGGGVLRDDVADRTRADRLGNCGATGAQADEQRVSAGGGAGGVPGRLTAWRRPSRP